MGKDPIKSFAAAFAAKPSLVDTLDGWGNIYDYSVPPMAPISTFWDKPIVLPLDQPIDLDKSLSIYLLEKSLVERINKRLSSRSPWQMSLFCPNEINTPFSSCDSDAYISKTTKSVLGPIFRSLEQQFLDSSLTSIFSPKNSLNESDTELSMVTLSDSIEFTDHLSAPVEQLTALVGYDKQLVVTPVGAPIRNVSLSSHDFHEQLIRKLSTLKNNSKVAESSPSNQRNKESTNEGFFEQGIEFLQTRKDIPDKNPLNKEFLAKLTNIQAHNSSVPFIEITKEIPRNDFKLAPTENTEVRINSPLIFKYPESYAYKISRVHTQRLSLVNYNLDREFCLFRKNPDFTYDSFYLPEFLKVTLDEEGQPISVNGLCPYCPSLIFLSMENESYANHLSTVHGVYPDDSLIPEPIMVGKFRIKRPGSLKKKKERNTLNNGSDGAVCPICHVIVQIDTNVPNERVMTKYLKHFHSEHKERELKEKSIVSLGQSLDNNSQSAADSLLSQIDDFTSEVD